jgi:hypothetical protein
MSSLDEITTDQLGNRVWGEGGVCSARLPPLLQQASGQIFKETGSRDGIQMFGLK